MPDVAVVIPTRNRRAWLAQTLGSVLAQQEVAVEVVVVDEASSDGTAEWLAGLGDPRVRTLRHDVPRRLPGARNAGAAASSAEVLAFVDDDDLWARRKLRLQLDAMHAAGAAWSFPGSVHVDEHLRAIAVHRAQPGLTDGAELVRHNIVPGGGSGVVVTRAAFDGAGGFDEQLGSAEDWECWLRLRQQGPAVGVDAPLVAYRRVPQSMSHRIEPMLAALSQVADRHPELARDPATGVPTGALRTLAMLACEAGERRTAAQLIWRDRADRGTLLRAPLYLLGSRRLARLRFERDRAALRWAAPLIRELDGVRG